MAATTFSQLIEEIKTEALNLWQGLKTEVLTFEHNIVPVIEADLVLVLSQFKGLATSMIMTLATQEFANLTGGQKNTITVNTIIEAAKAAGKPIVAQDAQLLAQQAYNAIASTIGKN
jgi:hypothetical protein